MISKKFRKPKTADFYWDFKTWKTVEFIDGFFRNAVEDI